MDLDTFETMLMNTGIPRIKTKPYMRIVAHWINRVRNSGPYATGSPKDIASLKKLSEFGLVRLEWNGSEAVATLTEKGRKLDKEFFKAGYYIRG